MIREEVGNSNPLSRLRWACRRGMLELDVLLGNFLEEAYAGLTASEQQHFAVLLENTDPTLLAWLMGHATPEDPALAAITTAIRHHASARI